MSRRFEMSNARVSESGKTLISLGFGGDSYSIAELFKSFAGKEVHITLEEVERFGA
jgi:hypothetical protein